MIYRRLRKVTSSRASKERGFAIVMALSLLSLVFLLVISLVNLVGIDLTLGDARKERVLAQAHARMGMMVAIGEIQKHLGPDTRVSATADILDERIERLEKFENLNYEQNPAASINSLVPLNQAIDLDEDNELDIVPFGQRYWTGVWKHRARRKGASDDHRAGKPLPKNLETADAISTMALIESEYDPHPAIEVAWLVSGNEGWSKKLAHTQGETFLEYVEIPDAIPFDNEQRNFVTGGVYGNYPNAWEDYKQSLSSLKSTYDHPLNELPDPEISDDTVWILKSPLLDDNFDPENPQNWKEHLRGEPIKVRKTRILSSDTSSDSLSNYGAYAYWVSDEGIKTKINVACPMQNEEVLENSILKKGDYDETRVTVALEPNIGEGSFNLNFADTNPDGPHRRLRHLDLGVLPKDKELEGQQQEKENRLSAQYHSLTTDSYGLLTDTRTGGLKRDLSHAFANKLEQGIDWVNLQDSKFEWVNDFLGFIFRDRIHYLKSVPIDPEAKSNLWNDTAATETINDYNAMLLGPFWRLLASFHNLYTNIKASNYLPEQPPIPVISNHGADYLPRATGDNFVGFDATQNELPAGQNKFWEETSFGPMGELDKINSKVNYFGDNFKRPGPRNHPIQPVLLELKYSQIPTVTDDQTLGLAMYPSVALWNPYNIPLEMDQLFVDIPLGHISISCYDPSELDRWRKWFFYAWDPGNIGGNIGTGGGGGGINRPSPPPPLPPGFGGITFPGRKGPVGLSGLNGIPGHVIRTFPSQSSELLPDPVSNDPRNIHEDFFQSIKRGYVYIDTKRKTPSWHYVDEEGTESEKRANASSFSLKPDVHFAGKAISIHNNHKRSLLLKISGLYLRPGEKANFTVKQKKTSTLPSFTGAKQYLEIELDRGPETHGFIYNTGFAIPSHNHLVVKSSFGDIHGIKPDQLEFYDPWHAVPYQANGDAHPKPSGITLFRDAPYSNNTGSVVKTALSWEEQKPIFKISRRFYDISDHGERWHYLNNAKVQLLKTQNISGEELPGNGFRIRYQLPGNSDKIVLEQFNLRALVNSYQDGFGDNWEQERFIGNNYYPNLNDDNREMHRDATRGLSEQVYDYNLPSIDKTSTPPVDTHKNVKFQPSGLKFYDFYDLPKKIEKGDIFDDIIGDLNLNPGEPTDQYNPFNLNRKIVPRITSFSNNIGFFHDDADYHGGDKMSDEPIIAASLFDIPLSPMLSILQLRHANLNDYSHGPSYVLGNSYANPQVGRYKTWGRVRAISVKPLSAVFNIENNWLASKHFQDAYQNFPHLLNRNPWTRFINELNLHMPPGQNNYGTIRDPDAQNDHQNTTVDHSFYANRALLDGFFMSGVGQDRMGVGSALLAKKSNEWGAQSIDQMELEASELYKITKLATYSPYRNTRLKPLWQDGVIRETSYGEKTKLSNAGPETDSSYRYQTIAADLLVEGAFNINSTSVDSWVSQLSSLREIAPSKIPPSTVGSKTPFPRFTSYPSVNNWNKIRILEDDEIDLLAHCLVEQIKLRGPFLSYSDFVNRRIQGIKTNRLDSHYNSWNQLPETRDSVLGFRGAVQAAIAEAEINQSGFPKQSPAGVNFTGQKGEWPDNPMIPFVPSMRFLGPDKWVDHFVKPFRMNFISTEFGMHAVSRQEYLQPRYVLHTEQLAPNSALVIKEANFGVGKKFEENVFAGKDPVTGEMLPSNFPGTPPFSFKGGYDDYSSAFEFGEAPENILAVENIATAANIPSWLMQSDVLSPLAPVTNARSDTFKIRVMGEPKADRAGNKSSNARAWIEVTVQRLPDYVKKDLDSPHHRPHEPFEDRNFNGYWDNDPSFVEHWLDLNQNSMDRDGERTIQGSVPDLPGVGRSGNITYADGLFSDLKLNKDPEEESIQDGISTMGINQRFGRKFKIIKFRWIKDQDV
jgi:hypothetical protein